jgi:hypothetical protein
MKKINVEFARQSSPHFIFFERILTRAVETFSYRLDYGYGYLLKRFICRYDGVNISTGKLAPPLFIEFYDNYNGRRRQVAPSPLPLLSTPNNGGGVEHEIQQAGGPDLFTVKTPKTSEKILNFNYPYMDTLRFDITGGGVPMKTYYGPVFPSIQIVLDGYYVPETSLEMWEKSHGKASGAVPGKGRVKWLKL